MKKVDVHIHTFRSPCGKNEMMIDSIVRKAQGLGLDYIGISDHIHTDTPVKEQFEDTVREIRAVNPNLKIYMGCELDIIKPGESTISDYLREHCDYIASIPMHGELGSLNVSVACGVLCYEIVRQRRK